MIRMVPKGTKQNLENGRTGPCTLKRVSARLSMPQCRNIGVAR